MDTASNDELNRRFAADLHAIVERVATTWAEDSARGRGRDMNDPFTGKTSEIPISDKCKAVHDALADAGVIKNEAVVAAIGEALKGAAHASMFSVLAAIDGSGVFERTSHARFVVNDQPLESYMHEIYFSSARNTED